LPCPLPSPEPDVLPLTIFVRSNTRSTANASSSPSRLFILHPSRFGGQHHRCLPISPARSLCDPFSGNMRSVGRLNVNCVCVCVRHAEGTGDTFELLRSIRDLKPRSRARRTHPCHN
jgi:hypothetical protein